MTTSVRKACPGPPPPLAASTVGALHIDVLKGPPLTSTPPPSKDWVRASAVILHMFSLTPRVDGKLV